MIKAFIISLLLFLVIPHEETTPTYDEGMKEYAIREVNRVRTNGCFCGRKYMPPTTEVKWNETLHKSALIHAKDMSRHNYFSHYDRKGRDVAERLELLHYDWLFVGENIGEGQKNFDEVLKDWLNSKTHCEMLMNEKVDEMAVANHGRFWVQHFGKQIPENAIRIGKKVLIPAK